MPRRRSSPSGESFQELAFPLGGLSEEYSYGKQPKGTTASAANVRASDQIGNRLRGGSRPGLAKWCSAQAPSAPSIQDITVVTIPNTSITEGMGNTRTVRVLTVFAGKLYSATTSALTSIDASFLSSTAPVVFGAPNLLVVYYTDGLLYKKYTATSGATAAWAASTGTLPSGGGEVCRMIETWRGRTVLSGLRSDPHNWFMSAVGNPLDFNYSPDTTVETQAVAGNNSEAGYVGDIVTGMVPLSDDVLLFMGDHTIWKMSGDPMAGGRLDMVTDAVGAAWGRAWAKDPAGNVYFFATRGGVFRIDTKGGLTPISQSVRRSMEAVNLLTSIIRLAWDEYEGGLHVYISSTTSTTACQHWFWEERSDAWWPDVFSNANHNPKTVCVYDGDSPDDRSLIIGSWDGYLRRPLSTATSDDGTTLSSYVWIGPILTKDMDGILIKDLQAIVAEGSADVTWSIYADRTAELALASNAIATGTWSPGKTLNTPARVSGGAVYLKLSSTGRWAIESIRARLQTMGKVMRRM